MSKQRVCWEHINALHMYALVCDNSMDSVESIYYSGELWQNKQMSGGKHTFLKLTTQCVLFVERRAKNDFIIVWKLNLNLNLNLSCKSSIKITWCKPCFLCWNPKNHLPICIIWLTMAKIAFECLLSWILYSFEHVSS